MCVSILLLYLMPSFHFSPHLKSGNEIGFAFECEIYFNERHGWSPSLRLRLKIIIIFYSSNEHILMLYQTQVNSVESRNCGECRKRRLSYRLVWMDLAKCERKLLFLYSTMSLFHITQDITENNKLHFTPTS